MTRHKPPEARRAQILTAARARFIGEGYSAARVSDIARDAGLSKGGVYFHFASKREIFDALVEEEFNESMRFLKEVSERPGTLLEMFAALSTHYLRFFTEHDELARFRVVIGEMAMRAEDVRDAMIHLNRAYLHEIGRLLERGVRDGELRHDLDVESTALLLKALLDGLQETLALDPDVEQRVERIIISGLDLVLRGVAAPDATLAAELTAAQDELSS